VVQTQIRWSHLQLILAHQLSFKIYSNKGF
jgi:hypothetical protein